MAPIKILNLTIKPKSSSGVDFFYANLVFKLNPEANHLKQYLEHSQKEYIKRRIFKTYRDISFSGDFDNFETIEQMLESLREQQEKDVYYEGWDFNPDSNWFTHNQKFDVWRLHEYFTDNVITRALFDKIKDISFDVPTTSRSSEESELISCFESLKYWWD